MQYLNIHSALHKLGENGYKVNKFRLEICKCLQFIISY